MSKFTLADLNKTLYSKQRGGYYTDKVHIGSYCVNKLDIDFALEETPLVCKPFKELTLAFPPDMEKADTVVEIESYDHLLQLFSFRLGVEQAFSANKDKQGLAGLISYSSHLMWNSYVTPWVCEAVGAGYLKQTEPCKNYREYPNVQIRHTGTEFPYLDLDSITDLVLLESYTIKMLRLSPVAEILNGYAQGKLVPVQW